ncbi:lipoprotein signal peptidase [Staphylococcus muscae]|uniref:Lipoprotein signal peptidase n=1 Tax=Staphylococcus muscae TaxID=1294 RepID=A0A240C2Z7_9STAP|nr:signal peptidase II [Staphylococcus muscae]AVQ32800.1 lipoprotein signal peptidase [Staphylococcus muscae]PNZ05808.1 lipoprotein signal peptidase [Staphylococcus muscae]GGA81065.1 lipoprotein signal peptidase [Staphylococcus muscae]SNW01683.1 signal peptidase II [Staphylococcus muscae]
MKRQYYIGLSLIIFFIVVIADQLTKWVIATQMTIGESFNVIPHFLNITSHRNDGAAWGILSGQMGFFYLITIVIIVALVIFYIKEAKNHMTMQVAITLLLAGAIGNFIDRVLNGEVVDFVDTVIFGYDFPIFNIADASLTIGVAILVILLLTDKTNDKRKV